MDDLAMNTLAYMQALDKYINQQLKKGPDKTPALENILAMAWYTIRSNVAWLVTQCNKKNVLIWQNISTIRLAYETIADINFLVKLSNREEVAKRLTASCTSIKSYEDFIVKSQDKSFQRETNIGLTTEKRIIAEYGSDDSLYAIYCLFTHFSFLGAQIAYDLEEPENDPTIQMIIHSLPDLLHRCAIAFSQVKLFENIQNETQAELEQLCKEVNHE